MNKRDPVLRQIGWRDLIPMTRGQVIPGARLVGKEAA